MTFKKDLQNIPGLVNFQFLYKAKQQCCIKFEGGQIEIIFIKALPKGYLNKLPESNHYWWEEWYKEVTKILRKLGYYNE